MTWLFLGIGSVGCVNRLKCSLYGVFCFVCTPRMCSRNGMLDIHLLPPHLLQKEMAKETSALKPQILQNYFLTTSWPFVRYSRGWLWLFRLSFLKHPLFSSSSLWHLAQQLLALGLGRSQDGQPPLLRRWMRRSIPDKATGSGRRAGVPSSFSGSCSEQSMLYFIITTPLMVFTKWQSQVLWVAVQ